MRPGSVIRQAVSHGVAAAVVITLSVVFAVVGYAGLLAWAVLAGQPLGGALALPFMMLAALVSSTLAVVAGLFPATVLAHYICRRWFRWPLWTEIPVSTVLTAGAAVSVAVVVGWLFDVPVATSVWQGGVLAMIVLVPLGVYWWVLQFSCWGIELGQRLSDRAFRPPTRRASSMLPAGLTESATSVLSNRRSRNPG